MDCRVLSIQRVSRAAAAGIARVGTPYVGILPLMPEH